MIDNEALIAKIDGMTHVELARVWRFAEGCDPILQGEAGERLSYRLFKEFGGITPEISKEIGWGK